MPYIDNLTYYQRRRLQQDFVQLLRNYYEGHPYNDLYQDTQTQNQVALSLWRNVMVPDPSDEEPVYLENCIRNKIDDIVMDVFPIGTRIVWEGLGEGETLEARQRLLAERLLNFTNDYPSGDKGLREWIYNVLADCALTGDGLAQVESEGVGQDAIARLKFFPSEAWDMEMTDRHLPLFYRIEYGIKDDAGEEHIRRWDIYRDRIIQYSGDSEVVMGDDGAPPPNPRSLNQNALLTAPVLRQLPEDAQQSALMRTLDRWIVEPLRWQRLAADDERGASEVMLNDLSTTDDINRLLRYWKEGAINAGSPPLVALDIDLPNEPGAESKELNKSDLGAGAVLKAASADFDRQGKLTYPENVPTQSLHEAVLDRYRVAIAGSSPLSNLDPSKISRFGELSGFSKSILEKIHVQRVGRIRDNMLQTRIASLLQTGLIMLAMRDAIPDFSVEDARKVRVRFEFGGEVMSPDEKLKITTMVAMCQKLGLPPTELIAIMQQVVDLQDREGTIKAMEEAEQQAQEMEQMLAAAKSNPPQGKTNGTDKRGL
ncbi:MAG: hypothetical protein WC381_10765 [Kiritimatiellia bacterium]|jgi:hypothetical protein